MGKKSMRTPGRRRALIAALREGHGFVSAAHACDLAPSVFREWRAKDATFAAECAEAADFAGDIAEHELYTRGVHRGDTLALLAWLRAHRPERFYRKMMLALDPTTQPAVAPAPVAAWIYPREALTRPDPATLIEAVVIEAQADDDVTDDMEDKAA
jgi:hypothetical protein